MRKVKFNRFVEKSFYKVVDTRIDSYFSENNISKKGNWIYATKVIICLFFTILIYVTLITSHQNDRTLALLFILFGLFNTVLVFNVAHDASHHAVSEKKWVNQMLEYMWDTAGISSYFWKLKHNISHHGFTNVPGKDGDIDQSGLILLNPYTSRKWFHRYQHIYAPFLYALLSLNIIYIKDFKLLFANEFGNKTVSRHPVKEIVILLFGKLFFISYMIVIPKINLQLSWMQIIGYHLLMNLAIGWLIGFVLVPVHVTEAATYRKPDDNGLIHCDWGEHQMEATVDFSANNYIVNFFSGGLNTHVAHHLFPSINHIHYYQITKIIRQTALELKIPYRNYSWFRVFVDHLKFLKRLGNDLQAGGETTFQRVIAN
jgi:linoleoyl-CoA desaturase